jgi:PPOX class probable F420-dependent enzyme
MQLSDPIRKFLERPNFAVLATISPSGRPQATPVWFLVDGQQILINTGKGLVKLRNIRANPHVALSIYDRDEPYTHVQIRGKVVAIDEAHGARDIDRLSLRYRGQPYKYQPGVTPADRVSIRIKPTGLTSGGIR